METDVWKTYTGGERASPQWMIKPTNRTQHANASFQPTVRLLLGVGHLQLPRNQFDHLKRKKIHYGQSNAMTNYGQSNAMTTFLQRERVHDDCCLSLHVRVLVGYYSTTRSTASLWLMTSFWDEFAKLFPSNEMMKIILLCDFTRKAAYRDSRLWQTTCRALRSRQVTRRAPSQWQVCAQVTCRAGIHTCHWLGSR